MHLESILRRLQPLPGFVYAKVEWADSRVRPSVHVHIRPRSGSQGICSSCFRKRPGYDVLGYRSFGFVPLWGLAVFLVYAMRRVDCRRCGVTVEAAPWAAGKMQTTHALVWFLASWAKVLSWREVAKRFHSTWDTVFRCVEHAVRWGLAHRNLDGVVSIGVEEFAWKKRHKYLTLVYQIDHRCKRLLHVARDRTVGSFNAFFDMLGEERSKAIVFVASDMWQAFRNGSQDESVTIWATDTTQSWSDSCAVHVMQPQSNGSLPGSNLNDAAGANRCNIRWASTDSTGVYGDDINLGALDSGKHWVIDAIVTYAVPDVPVYPLYHIGDYYSSITLYGGVNGSVSSLKSANFGGGADSGGNIVCTKVSYPGVSGTQYQQADGTFNQLWQVVFSSLGWQWATNQQSASFFVIASPKYDRLWFNHAQYGLSGGNGYLERYNLGDGSTNSASGFRMVRKGFRYQLSGLCAPSRIGEDKGMLSEIVNRINSSFVSEMR